MSGTTEAFSRVKIDALLRDAGREFSNGVSGLFECALPDGTQSDHVLCPRSGCPMAVPRTESIADKQNAECQPDTRTGRPGQDRPDAV